MTARKKGVLIVDDEPILREALKRLLIHDFEMCLADSGHKALELLASRAFDAVVTDQNMPGLDGVSLLKRVRVNWPCVRRILTSGHLPADLDSHLRSGLVQHFVSKPAGRDDLIAAVESTGIEATGR